MAGRPTKYNKEMAEQARKLCLLGATDVDLADFFEVTPDTITKWKKRHPAFLLSIKEAKDLADGSVVKRLYERALGFEHDSEEIKVINGEVIRVPVRKIYPPDTTAAIFWLKNRQKDKWRDKHELTDSEGNSVTQLVVIRSQDQSSQTDNKDATVSPNGEPKAS